MQETPTPAKLFTPLPHSLSESFELKPGMDKDKDPMAGIMDLMKNMYDEGDDEMKWTIVKAWSDARSGKATDPMKGFGH
ncbi:calcyclin-binding protein-like [Dioscorea cayenensis subsp. rotundata]|uniref:Calcyclin-binding protein-like n=1 Tax=Dioscorea cayennensis subsp. rotundata TaxID=55577 RepID=A0AB40CH04_DIOCR|nr:calcyclin-binding protein-like [Dioscorea cayenensis subsp. rotundata]